MLRSFKMGNKLSVSIFLLALLLFHGVNNYVILTNSRYTPINDPVRYFQDLSNLRQSFKEAKFNLRTVHNIHTNLTTFYGNHPKFFIYTAVPFSLFRMDKNIVAMTNLIYFAILLFATYGIGKRMYSFEVGILSSFFVSMFPAVFGLSRNFLLDFPLAAMVGLTFYLFTLNKFDKLSFSFLAGLVISLGLLIKEAYFIFLIPMLLYFFIQQKEKRNNKSIAGFCFSIFLGLLVSIKNYIDPAKLASFSQWAIWPSSPDPYYYLKALLNRQLFPIFFLLFVFSLIFCFINKKYFLPIVTIALLTIFSAFANRMDRFILPIFSYIAVMVAGFVWSSPKNRKTFTIIIVVYSLLQYFAISYKPFVPERYGRFFFLDRASSKGPNIDYVDLSAIIDEGDWKSPAEEIIKIIEEDKRGVDIDSEVTLGLFTYDTREKIHFALIYWAIIRGFRLEIYTPATDTDMGMGFTERRFDNPIDHFDFVIVPDGVFENRKIGVNQRYRLNYFTRNFINKYEFVRTIFLPDNFSCSLYKKVTIVN